MRFLTIFSLLSLLAVGVHADFQHNPAVSPITSANEAGELPPADFSIQISAKVPRRDSKKFVRHKGNIADSVVLAGAAFDHEYVVNVSVGGQYFNLILDTGSSDFWVVQEGFSCFNLNGTAVPASACDFGPAHFNPEDSPTFEPFPNVTFFVQYFSGENMKGPAGFDTVTIGGLSVTQQTIGIPNHTAFLGDSVSEGVLGLAYPPLTSIFGDAAHLLYTPFFLNAVAQNKLKNPFFSISLDRPTFQQGKNDPFDPNLGLLAFGGIVPVLVLKTSVTVPNQRYTFTNGPAVPSNSTDAELMWYTVDIDSFIFPGSDTVVTKSNNTDLDTGSPFIYLPTPVAAAYNDQFDPPAILDPNSGLYFVDCNATAPAFTVVVAGVSFIVDPRDQIVPQGNGTDGCWSGTQDGGPDVPGNLFALGDPFLHNVVITYNPIAGEVTITQRVPY